MPVGPLYASSPPWHQALSSLFESTLNEALDEILSLTFANLHKTILDGPGSGSDAKHHPQTHR